MKLEEMSTKDLLALHNAVAEEPAGPKTFATKTKLIARIEAIAATKNLDLASFGQSTEPEASELHMEPRDLDAADADAPTEKKPGGKGVGRLARELLMYPKGYPHAVIADFINEHIPGAAATANSVRWYAGQLRKKGIQVPPRKRVRDDHIWVTDPEAAEEWVRGVQAVAEFNES